MSSAAHRGDASQQPRLQLVDELITAKLSELQQTIDLRRSEGVDAALAVVRTHVGKGLMDRINSVLGESEREETALLGAPHRRAQYALLVGRVALPP
jgi:CHASE3 domain sensor protein